MLYRVVTHTIKEEMLDQPPAGSEFATHGWYPTGPTGPLPTASGARHQPGVFYPEIPYNTDSAIKFRMDARTAWARYLWRMRAYLLSALNGGEDLPHVEERLFRDIDEIGDMVKPYYGLVATKQISQLMRAFVLTEIDIVRALKMRQDISALRAKHTQQVDEFAAFLNAANPRNWSREAVAKVFNDLMTCWQTEAVSRINKDWVADLNAVDDGHRIILAGNDSGPAFADIFSRGIITQFPERFNV